MIDKKINLYQNVDFKGVTVDNTDSIVIIEGYASMYRMMDGSLVVDRDDEIVNTDGIDITGYLDNPILIYNHDWDKVIGKSIEITKDYNGLKIKAEVHKLTNFEHIFEAVKKGLIKSLSLGFRAKGYKWYDDDTLEITESSLFEISLAPVQSNPKALFDVIGTKSLGVNLKHIKEQNDITCDDMQCFIKKLKGDTNMTIESKKGITLGDITTKDPAEPTTPAPAVAPEPEPAKEPVTPVIAVAPEPEPAKEPAKEPVKEPSTPEVKKDPMVDLATLVNSIAEAQLKADELRKIKEDEAKAKEDADKLAIIDAEKAKVQSVLDYIAAQAEAVKNTPVDALDVDAYDPIYEAITSLQEAIEQKVTEAIEAAKQAS